MSSVVISGNTSGSVTLSAPDVAGSTTITLPTTTGTVALTSELGGITLLATVAATSGNSVSATGLDLTSYKFLQIFWKGLQVQDGNTGIGLCISSNNATSPTVTSLSEGDIVAYGMMLDLSTGASYAVTSALLNITNASTAVYFRLTGSAFVNAAGQFKIYGMK